MCMLFPRPSACAEGLFENWFIQNISSLKLRRKRGGNSCKIQLQGVRIPLALQMFGFREWSECFMFRRVSARPFLKKIISIDNCFCTVIIVVIPWRCSFKIKPMKNKKYNCGVCLDLGWYDNKNGDVRVCFCNPKKLSIDDFEKQLTRQKKKKKKKPKGF